MRRLATVTIFLLCIAALTAAGTEAAVIPESARLGLEKGPMPGLDAPPEGIPESVWAEAEQALRQPNVAVVITAEGVQVVEAEDAVGRLPTAPVPDVAPTPTPLEPAEGEFELGDRELNAPLSDYEVSFRGKLGFAVDLDPSSAFSDRQAASRAFVETGARLTAGERAEVLRRSSLGDRVLGALDGLTSQPEFVAARIVHERGGSFEIGISDDSSSEFRKAIESALGGLEDEISVVGLGLSRSDFDAAIIRIHALGELSSPAGMGSLADVPVASDPWNGELVLFLEEDLSAEVQAVVRAEVGIPVRVEVSAQTDAGCGQLVCDQHFRGGLRYQVDGGNCSNAATIQRNASQAYVLTAGHCTDPDGRAGSGVTVWMDGGPGSGYPVSWILDNWDSAGTLDEYDIAYYPISHWSASDLIYQSGGSPSRKLTRAANANDLVDGSIGCLAGAMQNGARCALIDFHRSDNLIAWDEREGQVGDSGGAWISPSGVFLGTYLGFTSVNDLMIGWPVLNTNMGGGWDIVSRDAWADQLANNDFYSTSGWTFRATTNANRTSSKSGYSDNYELFSNCPSGSQCSWYQNTGAPLYSYKNYGTSTFARCGSQGTCVLDLALWGLGGGNSVGKSVRATIPANGEAYIATTFQFTVNRNWVRFEVYNSIPGRNLYFSDPMFVPFW